ncbi:hypothetical protein K502DRAFT_327995 [Neoconidiobolus thromboides FSU 785]|nr:hypothetical protein K502DRAFT_327995 [Neoconidiobolus thromboides FSU 785]
MLLSTLQSILLTLFTLTATLYSQKIDSDKEFLSFGFKKENGLQCPSLGSTCKMGYYDYYPNQFSAPECWLKTLNGYTCHYLDDLGLIECPPCYINVGFCGYPIFSKNQTTLPPPPPPPIKESVDIIDSPNAIKKPNKCPTSEDSCSYDTGIKVKFTNSMVPQCWGLYKSEYVCIKKENNKCPLGYLDIKSCLNDSTKLPDIDNNIDIPNKCPTQEDICYFNGEIPVTVTTKNAPKCWKATQGGYLCEMGNKGQCSPGFQHLSKCGYKDTTTDSSNTEVVPQYCPPLSTSCTYSPVANFKLTDKSPPECWLSTISGYACKYKRELEGKCPTGTIDTTPCRPGVVTDIDNELKCPKETIKCLYRQTSLFSLNSPTTPECWAKTPNGYVCRYKSELGGICPLNVLDISVCKGEEAVVVNPNCPNNVDKCNYNNLGYFSALNPKAPECWIKGSKSFYCRFKKDFNGKCPDGAVDIGTCPILTTKRICPKVDDTCVFQNTNIFRYTDFTLPECWAKVENTYQCRYKAEFNGKCPNLSIDITACEVPMACPNYNDKCKNNLGIDYKLQDGFAPDCWKRGKTQYECKGKGFLGTTCEAGYLDIKTCNRERPPPPCPNAANSQCAYNENLSYSYLDPNAPTCWIMDKKNQHYTCKFQFEFKENKCPYSYLNIKERCINLPNDGGAEGDYSICPMAGSRCLYNQNGFILLGTPHAPECWVNTPNGFVCKYKSELPNFECHANSIDITKCSSPKVTDSFLDEAQYFNPYLKPIPT